MNMTIDILVELTQRLMRVTNIVGIELLNEPSNVEILDQFCKPHIALAK
jgi:glucan 1,3-beta-glucosidase